MSKHRTGRLAGLALVLTVAGAGAEPPWPMPEPNAREFYLAAATGLKDPDGIEQARTLSAVFRKSIDKLADDPLRPRKEAAVAANTEALAKLRAGFAYLYRDLPNLSFEAGFQYFQDFRNLARLLDVEAQLRACQGDWAGAVNAKLDGLRLGQDIQMGAPLVGGMVGYSCQLVARADLDLVADRLFADEARLAARRLEVILGRALSYPELLRNEREWMVGALKALLEKGGDNWRQRLAAVAGNFAANLDDYLKARTPEQIVSDAAGYWGALVARAGLPYDPTGGPPLPAPHPIYQALAPMYRRVQVTALANDATNRMLLLSLALHAWQAERGQYPDMLEKLVPGYLECLPLDPFAKLEPFRYGQSGKGYILYSLGPDGDDDGGAPVPAQEPERGLAPEAEGDLVMPPPGA